MYFLQSAMMVSCQFACWHIQICQLYLKYAPARAFNAHVFLVRSIRVDKQLVASAKQCLETFCAARMGGSEYTGRHSRKDVVDVFGWLDRLGSRGQIVAQARGGEEADTSSLSGY